MENIMSENIGELAAALAKAQGTFSFARKDSTAPLFEKEAGGRTVKSGVRSYADLASVLDAVRKGLAENGLAIIQAPFSAQGGSVTLRTTLMHASGQWIASEITFPADRMGGIHGWGSALTYARRYALAAMVGIAQDDDDGMAAQDAEPKNRRQREAEEHKETQRQATASNPDPMTPDQLKALMVRLGQRGCDSQEKYLADITKVLGREVRTSKSLTKADFHRYMQVTDPDRPADSPF